MKLKILSIIAVVVISAVGVGFTNKEETIELVNEITITLNDDQSTISYYLLEDYFTMTDDEIFVTLDGEKIDITKYCSSDSQDIFTYEQDIFTYEKEVGNHIQKIAIAGEPNTKSGIALARSVGNVAISQESHSSQYSIVSYFNDERTQAEQLGYCCNDGEPKWFEDAQEFLKIDKF